MAVFFLLKPLMRSLFQDYNGHGPRLSRQVLNTTRDEDLEVFKASRDPEIKLTPLRASVCGTCFQVPEKVVQFFIYILKSNEFRHLGRLTRLIFRKTPRIQRTLEVCIHSSKTCPTQSIHTRRVDKNCCKILPLDLSLSNRKGFHTVGF